MLSGTKCNGEGGSDFTFPGDRGPWSAVPENLVDCSIMFAHSSPLTRLRLAWENMNRFEEVDLSRVMDVPTIRWYVWMK